MTATHIQEVQKKKQCIYIYIYLESNKENVLKCSQLGNLTEWYKTFLHYSCDFSGSLKLFQDKIHFHQFIYLFISYMQL